MYDLDKIRKTENYIWIDEPFDGSILNLGDNILFFAKQYGRESMYVCLWPSVSIP